MDCPDLPPENPNKKPICSNLSCRILLAVLCAIMVIVGFLFFVLGCLFTWSESTMYTYLQKPIDSFLKLFHPEADSSIKRTVLSALLDYTAPIGQVGFWIGICIMVFCGIGLHGAIVKNRFALFIFASMMLAKILVVSVIVVAYHANPNPVVNTFKDLVQQSVEGYKSLESQDKHSLILNLMMPYLQCCGVTDGAAFAGVKNFDTKFIDGDNVLTIPYPYTCCKLKENYERLPNKCPASFDDRNSNVKTGCWPKVETRLLSVLSKVSYIIIITTVVEFLLVCITIHTTLTMDQPLKTTP